MWVYWDGSLRWRSPRSLNCTSLHTRASASFVHQTKAGPQTAWVLLFVRGNEIRHRLDRIFLRDSQFLVLKFRRDRRKGPAFKNLTGDCILAGLPVRYRSTG